MKYTRTAIAVVFACYALLPAGCNAFGRRTPPRDFDELVKRMLGSMENRTPVDAAANLFNVTSPDERRDAVAYLQTKAWGHEPPYMKAYLVLATDPHPMVRAQTMRALGTSSKPDEAVPALLKGLADPEPQVRRDAAIGLRGTFNDSAFEPLALHLKEDVDVLVRGYCAKALIHARSPLEIRILIDALGDNDAAVSRFSYDSLVAITGQSFGYDIRGWITWYTQTYTPATTPGTRPGGR